MKNLTRVMAFALMLLLVAVLVNSSARAAEDEEVKKAQAEILALAKKLSEGKDVAQEAQAIRKKYDDLNTIMHAYKPSPKGGIGTGLEPKAGDGIEIKLINLGKRALPAATLAKEKDALLKSAYVNLAIGEITMHYAPEKPRGGKGAKEWKQFTEDMNKGTKELIQALKDANPANVKKAALDVNNACQNCHSDFRD